MEYDVSTVITMTAEQLKMLIREHITTKAFATPTPGRDPLLCGILLSPKHTLDVELVQKTVVTTKKNGMRGRGEKVVSAKITCRSTDRGEF